MRNKNNYISVSPALSNIKHLAPMLSAQVNFVGRVRRYVGAPEQASAVLAWGRKPSSDVAARYAKRHTLPLVRIEDAFLRSVELGAHCPPLGIVVDAQGIYYDARSASELEALITEPLDEEQQQRADSIRQRWCELKLSKYNLHRSQQVDYGRPYVLLVDQTAGDASINYGLASAESFQEMLLVAKQRFPEHLLVVKTHPDVIAGLKQGHFTIDQLENEPNVKLEARPLHTPDIIEGADAVFCVTSQVGFEALLWGKPVYTFGMPFYAGWGLTEDALKAPSRREQVSLYQLLYAALVRYARYWHPEKQAVCQIEELMEWIGQQSAWRQRFPEKLLAERFPRWKREHLKTFFSGTQLQFLPRGEALPENEPCVVWGRQDVPNRLCVEDGFIRSVGLGADLTAPKSWVIDDIGMYYDATRPSRLEAILNGYDFSENELNRAERLVERLVKEQVSKYNVGDNSWQRPETAKTVILVPGQVESDASIQYGSPHLKKNVELLAQVRKQHPDAHIVYKPHPDVVAGLRTPDSNESEQVQFCDEIVIRDNMASLLDKLKSGDEVHTMTSLTGFEALLRGIKVCCYGQPFYSGWGLTDDLYPNSRRQKTRSLHELVAATLIIYPRYLSSKSGCLTSVEQALDEIAEERLEQQSEAYTVRLSRRIKRMILRLKRF
ncbi:capsular polysaccharide biosynthesis protein [Idiomarina sp. Sol25]|uniref:capsular polysaccharide biosynthesis protein n=1 Tax=Idiomarina sp. Sol25 TaxID=3064000 RepID=UPI00294AAFEB|nr:capsular polysaccharide biosynthesis protein [Idiomarina sp. Sol25]MDV6328096.1 capsular polysaccharide biosynthesis protein [Idiomarina sp. Sol25]